MTTTSFKFDVFLSFRGEDTRYGFISHLHKALNDKQIEAFVDHELSRGDEISPALSKAIEESQISVVIFSEKYANSRWCLDELVHILKCKEKGKRIVIPVYHHIDPSVVRNQTNSFQVAFDEHEKCFDNSLVKKWREALTEAANLSGLDTRTFKLESQLIEQLVEDILKKLMDRSPSVDNNLVGIESKIKKLESLLRMESVHILGISGIGGMGKTTLASIVFNKISNQFESSYFIQNVMKESEKYGYMRCQQELLSTILGDENVNVDTSILKRTFTKARLGRKKLLIVFDDVTDFRQIEFLIQVLYGHVSSSRIIITTRDKQVLKNCRVDQVYEVQTLSNHEALELFSRYAFRQNYPAVDYVELSNKIVRFAGGVPLALKIFGSFLFDKRIEVWKSAMDKLSRFFHMDIQNVLKISYDELDDEVQSIFLDIACIFKGKDSDLAKKILKASGFFAEIGISTLIDKSMITISDYKKIMMHDLLQAMGKEIVRQEAIKEPGNRTRLWNHEDIFHVLAKNSGTEIIEGISLDTSKVRDISFHTNAFLKMHKLRLLEFYSSSYAEDINKVNVFHGLELEPIFTGLKYLHWHGFPLTSLPPNFCLKNLIILEMPYSKVQHLWNSYQLFEKLEEINLSYSKYLIDLPDLSCLPNLESLILVGCTSLLEIPSSIQYLRKLTILDLSDCKSLRGLPNCVDLKSLTKLYLSGCSDLNMLPEISCSIEELYLDETAIEELPSSIECLCRLVLLDLKSCSRLKNLPNNICKLKSLKRLTLSDCSLLDKLPEDLGALESLMELEVEGTAVREVPASIFCLNNLNALSFRRYCKSQDMVDLKLPPFNLHHLKELDLSNCGIVEMPNSLGKLTSLERLHLRGNNFLSIPSSIRDLAKLSELDISNCKRLQCLPDLPLISIDAHNCVSLEELSGLQILDTIVSTDLLFIVVNFVNCFKLWWNLESIVDVLSKMQHLATLWKEEYYDKGCDKLPRACICYPGSEIPKWFDYHSAESFISIKLPQDWFNCNFVGFALCIVVAFKAHRDHDSGFAIHCKCKHRCVDHSNFDDWAIFLGGPFFIESDHVFMGFDFHMYPPECIAKSFNNEVSFKFYLEHLCGGGKSECCWVKNCGVSLMYTQDLEKANGHFCMHEKIEEQTPKKLKSL